MQDTRENDERESKAKEPYPIEISRSLVEEFSGRRFEYQEILPKFENYEADLGMHEVSKHCRSLADVCLLLMNTNEFLFVD